MEELDPSQPPNDFAPFATSSTEDSEDLVGGGNDAGNAAGNGDGPKTPDQTTTTPQTPELMLPTLQENSAAAAATTTTQPTTATTTFPTTPDRSLTNGGSRDGQGQGEHHSQPSPVIGGRRISKRDASRNSPSASHINHHHRHSNNAATTTSSTTPRECICGRGIACVGMTQAFRLLGDPRSYYVELPRYRKDAPAYKYVFRNNLRSAYLRHMARENPKINIDTINASPKRRFVALHHFHPAVVRAFYENPLTSAQKHKVPISITEHELTELDMDVLEEDQILSASGIPTGGYYFVPSYPHEEAHDDLKILIQAVRATRQQKKAAVKSRHHPNNNNNNNQQEKDRHHRHHRHSKSKGTDTVDENDDDDDHDRSSIPTNIEITSRKPTSSSSSEHGKDELPKPPPKLQSTTTDQTTATTTTNDVSSPSGLATTTKDKATISSSDVVSPLDDHDGDEGGTSATAAVVVVDPSAIDHPPIISRDKDHQSYDDVVVDGDDQSSTADNAVAITKDDDNDVSDHPMDIGGDDGGEMLNDDGHDDGEFDQLWNKDTTTATTSAIPTSVSEVETSPRQIESDVLVNQTIFEETDENDEGMEQIDAVVGNGDTDHHVKTNEDVTTPSEVTQSLASRRDADRPWATPKYRRSRDSETKSRLSGGAADYIDPNEIGDLTTRLSSDVEVDDGDDIARIAEGMTVYQESSNGPPSTPKREKYSDPPGAKAISPRSRLARGVQRAPSTDDDSAGSNDGIEAIELAHQLPGTDPTLRIQVHNDLIAWESKRRSDLTQNMECYREQWKAACDILHAGMQEARFAERLILGISKASRLFAESLQAVHDDKLFDDRGNAVKNSFLQNRLAKQRSEFEYSIESSQSEDAGQSGQSMLLGSILEVQLEVARAFTDSSNHLDQEILPEILELKDELHQDSQGLESKGESIIQELKRSEIEVKGIWDVFDAMVTGDLMEYSVHGSVHGSTHGGSSHGGSYHSSLTGGSGSIHGFLTPRGENEAPIVSSVHSPLVKSTFRQLGGVEDGWLIEMYYKSAVAYQRSVFGAAEKELGNLFQEIITLEERRFRRLHQVMLAFAPRQRRLFNKLPEQLKTVLENLVGMRIDEDSLQEVIDNSVRDRSRDHLRGSTAHKSSIMNRSRVNAMQEASENEVEEIEKTFGNPFASPMILLSKVVELKPTGLKGLVNNAWRPSLAVVTSDGNLLVFETPEVSGTPTEAFKSLYPPMNFDNPETWTNGRKAEIVRSLTPTITLRLTKSTIAVSRMQKRQLEIAEEKSQTRAGTRIMNAVKTGGAQQSRCTLRISSASDAAEWMNLLERTKKVLLAQSSAKGSRFRF